MKKKHLTKAVALLSVASLSLTGCSSFISEDVTSYPLASTMTSAELVDYYAKALQYDSVVSRNVDVHETKYEMKDIEGAKSEKLKELVSQCEAILGTNEYKPTEESLKLVSNDTYNYVKGALDNEVLTNGKVQNIRGALGYYFVDMTYDISPKQPGSFKSIANIVGLNGAISVDYKGRKSINEYYLTSVVNQLNEYFYDNSINRCAKYDDSKKTIKILEDTAPDYEPSTVDNYTPIDDSGSNTDDVLTAPGDETEQDTELSDIGTVDNTEDIDSTQIDDTQVDDTDSTSPIDTTATDETTKPVVDDGYNIDGENYTIVTPESRRLQLDVNLINEVVGSSKSSEAEMVDLDTIYNKPSTEGTISGYGIFPAGDDGLKTFGFDRSQLNGTLTLRYVFKDDSKGSGEILGSNIYIVDEEITNGINMSSNNVLVPEFLQSQLEQIVERADRVQANDDLAGLMSGKIYEDMGVGILRGYKEESTGISKYMSTIRQIINRDTANNSYLLEVETTTIEGAKDVDSYGTYKDISYVVVQQQGNKFVITDWCRISRTLTSEPPIDPESNVQKRLIALNLAGEISDDSKDSIKTLLSNLYTAGTNRILRGPKDLTIGGETKTVEKGMYDCFSSDTSILSEDDLEYENSTLRDVLVRHGTDISSIYSGTVTEWIGGYENQAEFTTEELVTYQGLNTGYYMQVYYLASVENDEWVISERTVLDQYEINDADTLASVQERVGQSQSN